MHRNLTLIAAAAITGAANAEVTFEFIGDGIGATDVSNNGAVVVGNEVAGESYETFRWTAATGAVQLGRGTVIPLGVGAGSPNVSDDGTRISATILSDDGTAVVAGRWEDGAWTELAFPLPPDGGILDSSYNDAWGISGDGQKVVGLYWRPGAPSGSGAHAMIADEINGTQSLSAPGRKSSRANGANYDGTVVAGWEASEVGYWFPVVWVNGVMTVLDKDNFGAPAEAVSGDGTVVVGRYRNPISTNREAARWVFDGANWNREELGALPGTPFGLGHVWANDVSFDGDVVVGTNRFFDNGPFSTSTGFLWTPELGMVDIVDFLENNGVDFDDETYQVVGCNGVSADGSAIVGMGRYVDPLNYRSFLIRILPDCPWDLDGDGAVGSGDLALIMGFWGQSGVSADFNGDGVGSDDLAALIGNWGPCP